MLIFLPSFLLYLTSLSSSDRSLPSLHYYSLFTSPFQSSPFAFPLFLHIPALSVSARSSGIFLQQPIGPAWLLQAPAELLGHDITHPVAATADAGAASGAGAAGAAETTGLSVPTNHSGPDSRHQCQRPGQSITCCTGADGGAKGKKQQLWFVQKRKYGSMYDYQDV